MEKEPSNINLSKLMKIANSTAGQELLSLVQNKKDEKFDEAMQLAQSGDFSQAQEIISKSLSTPEAEALMKKIRGGE